MRADRLISILLLLQKNGRMKARQLAAEMEVSERTIHRDVQALSYSGVPIFSERGPDGGIELLDTYRSDLTGLNREEVRALLMLGVPAHLIDLGLAGDLKQALRKLTASLPISEGEEEEKSRRFFLDPESWKDRVEAANFLGTLQKAVWEENVVRLTYRSVLGARGGFLTATLEPYGLVAKEGSWYLVGRRDAHLMVLAMSRIVGVAIESQKYEYPKDFSLIDFWIKWIMQQQENRATFEVEVQISAEHLPYLPQYFPGKYSKAANEQVQASAEHFKVRLTFSSFEEARSEILKVGGGIKVLAPKALRLSVIDFAEQIRATNSEHDDYDCW